MNRDSGHQFGGMTSGGYDAVTPAEAPPANQFLVIGTIAALAVLLVGESLYFGLAESDFWRWENWDVILTQAAIMGIIAAPMTMLLIAGQLDLSVGAGVPLCGMILTLVAQNNSLALGVVVAILVCAGLGVLNGGLVAALGINSLLVTFATFSLAGGLVASLSNGLSEPLFGFDTLGTARPFLHLPLAFIIFAVVAVVLWVILRFTPYGWALYAIGASPTSPRTLDALSRGFIFIAFVLTGLCVALSGMIQVSYTAAANPFVSLDLVLAVFLAVVLGGTSARGGRGSMVGTAVAVLGIAVLENGLELKSVSPYTQEIVLAVLLVVALAVSWLGDLISGLER